MGAGDQQRALVKDSLHEVVDPKGEYEPLQQILAWGQVVGVQGLGTAGYSLRQRPCARDLGHDLAI